VFDMLIRSHRGRVELYVTNNNESKKYVVFFLFFNDLFYNLGYIFNF